MQHKSWLHPNFFGLVPELELAWVRFIARAEYNIAHLYTNRVILIAGIENCPLEFEKCNYVAKKTKMAIELS